MARRAALVALALCLLCSSSVGQLQRRNSPPRLQRPGAGSPRPSGSTQQPDSSYLGDPYAGNPFLSAVNNISENDLVRPNKGDRRKDVVEGKTPANVVLERIVVVPAQEDTELIALRNLGGQTADLNGWKLTDSVGRGDPLVFGAAPDCRDPVIIAGGQKIDVRPKTQEHPCGYEFSLDSRDSVALIDNNGTRVSSVRWDRAFEDSSIRHLGRNSFGVLDESVDVVEVLRYLGDFEIFIEALEKTGLLEMVKSPSDPAYTGPELYTQPSRSDPTPVWPAWFGYATNRSAAPTPQPPPPTPKPPKEGVPDAGPYTLLAPNDEAFEVLMYTLGGYGNKIEKEVLLALPELKDIMLYHIIPGKWTSEYLKNNTAIFTSKGVEVTPFNHPPSTEGKIMFHDSCIDKPTPDRFTCKEQREFNACNKPFMISTLGAQWRGGYCERTCERCSCDASKGSFCAEADLVDLYASNGVVHVIDRILFPPPRFDKMVVPTNSRARSAPTTRDTSARNPAPGGDVRTIVQRNNALRPPARNDPAAG